MESFLEQLMKNLHKSGYPARKVAFGLERLYEVADAKGLSLNKALDLLRAQGVEHHKTNEKITFFCAPPAPPDAQAAEAGEGGGVDFMAQAQAMMAGMSPDELEGLRGMVEGRLAQMSGEERAAMFEQLKKMGLG
ncbi:MAG: hypothetical protein FJ138_15090 [Deltaproteobacteria bacterium]|nr:hypothetical protein [Deltaproteobacteria bacterium]